MVDKNSEVLVSVLCTAYNHEKYIRKCLDGFIMQKTNFKYEVLINDDASTDNTAQIIREYEEKYPEIIKPMYQTENQYSKGVKITTKILAPQAKGKYIALCEGDDYWTDENKLQLQVDAMEMHPECKMCVHKVKVFYETLDKNEYYPPFPLETKSMDSNEFMKITKNYAFQTSSYVFDAEAFKTYAIENPLFKQISPVDDICYLLYFGHKSSVYYIDQVMSNYRKESIGSWNWRRERASQEEYRRNHLLKMVKVYQEFDKYTKGKYHSLMQEKIFNMLWYMEDFKTMASKEYAVHRKNYSLKQRIYIWLKAYFPHIMQVFKK